MRHQLGTQLFEQRAEDLRQMAENAELDIGQSRKLQLVHLVDKIAIMKKPLRFQEEAKERELAFRNSIMRNAGKSIAMLAEHPYIIGDNVDINDNTDMSDSITESHGESKASDTEMGTSRNASVIASEARQTDDENDGNTSDVGNTNAAEAAVNSEANRKIMVNNSAMSEDQRAMNTLLDQGREKIRAIVDHNRVLHNELKAQHKTIVQLKQQEHRRKIADLVKEHEEELEAIKADQAIMADLLASQVTKNDVRADTEMAQNLLGMMLPAHVLEDLEKGQTPQPSQFEGVTLFFT
ncbi:hypothetical protein HDU76_011679, partial [Blyttiomyces sp. JEL0837]